jgi:hypothetical protein
MQPFIRRDNGFVYFQENAVVRRLLDESQKRGFGLNELAKQHFPQADWEQFCQLIGYSLSGYHELSYVSDESALAATEEARKLLPEATGCRDHGCPLHCCVPKEKP